MATQAPISEIKGLTFMPTDRVWMMYNNKPTEAPIQEILIGRKSEIGFYFWHQDFPIKDKIICYDNTFRVDIKNLFATKELLINSLL